MSSKKVFLPSYNALVRQKLEMELKKWPEWKASPVLVGLSGGADSVALTRLLHGLKPKKLTLAHFHHGFRQISDVEEQFCRDIAEELSLPIVVGKLRAQRPKGRSLEDWARDHRQAFLEEARIQTGSDFLVLAHHADDVLETALMRLLEGAGPGAVAGLRPRRGTVLRPLLEVRKEALLEFLRQGEHHWFEDESNEDPRFRRNRLRLDILPYLEEHSPGGLTPLLRSIHLLREEEEGLELLLSHALKQAQGTEGSLNLAMLDQTMPRPLAKRALVWHLSQHGIRPTRAQADQVFDLLDRRNDPKATGQRKIGFLGKHPWEMTAKGVLMPPKTIQTL